MSQSTPIARPPRNMRNEFELLRNVTVGQYIPTGSVVHRLDPRAKIIAALILIFTVVFTKSLIALAVLTLLFLGIVLLAKLPVRYVLRGVSLALPVLAFISLMRVIFPNTGDDGGKVYFSWMWMSVTRASMHLLVMGMIKILAFIFLTSVLTMTATTTEMTHGIELLLKPLEVIKLPAHEIALTNMIALRFVPTLAEELERILKAQASRGGDVALRQRQWNPFKAARAILPMVVPLFINALRRAEDLVLAMESRCYMGGKGRTKFVQFTAKPLDYVVPVLAILLLVIVVATPWPSIHTLVPFLGL